MSHSIPPLEKPRVAKMSGYKLVPQLRGEYYGFAVDRKPFDNPKLDKLLVSPSIARSFRIFFRAARYRRLRGSRPAMLAHNPKTRLETSIRTKRAACSAKRVIPKEKACRRSFSGTIPMTIKNSSPRRCRACGKNTWESWSKSKTRSGRVFLNKLQNDPFPVFRSGWGADYPDPDNFMKLFTSDSGNNNGRWKNPRSMINCSSKPRARAIRQSEQRSTTRRKNFSPRPTPP